MIESGERLSASSLWALQRRFFDAVGASAWQDEVVPSFVTSNAAIAQVYAEVIFRFLLDVGRPIRIVELGAGSGQFGFHCLRALEVLREKWPGESPSATWIMTDFTDQNLQYWREHAALRPLMAAGVLDVARFDAESDTEMRLQIADVQWADAEGPVVVIANYVFDGLIQDVFRIQEGRLEEGRPVLLTDATDLSDPELISHITVQYQYGPPPEPPYADPLRCQILADYQSSLGDAALGMPVGALDALDALDALSDGPMLLLAADKGYSHAHQLLGEGGLEPASHGSVSFMVNFDAVGRYIRKRGGFSWHVSPRAGALEFMMGMLSGTPQSIPRTVLEFDRSLERFSPIDFCELKQAIEDAEQPSLSACLALLRLSCWDPETFYGLHEVVISAADEADEVELGFLRRALTCVWDNFYTLRQDQDIAFAIARVRYQIDDHQQALDLYRTSLQLHGDDVATHHNIGLCLYHLGSLEAALERFSHALVLDPDYALSQDWRRQVSAALDGTEQSPGRDCE